MINMVNSERVKLGLKELAVSEKLSEIARKHSKTQLLLNKIFHKSPLDGFDHSVRIEKGNYQAISSAENVSTAPTITSSHIGLMNSPGHYKNIVGDWKEIGVGVMENTKGQLFVTQLFAIPVPVFNTKNMMSKLISNVHSFRIKNKLAPIKPIVLDCLNNYTSNKNVFCTDKILNEAKKELGNKNIIFSTAYISSFSGFSNSGKDKQLDIIKKPDVSHISISLNQDKNSGELYGIILFLTN